MYVCIYIYIYILDFDQNPKTHTHHTLELPRIFFKKNIQQYLYHTFVADMFYTNQMSGMLQIVYTVNT